MLSKITARRSPARPCRHGAGQRDPINKQPLLTTIYPFSHLSPSGETGKINKSGKAVCSGPAVGSIRGIFVCSSAARPQPGSNVCPRGCLNHRRGQPSHWSLLVASHSRLPFLSEGETIPIGTPNSQDCNNSPRNFHFIRQETGKKEKVPAGRIDKIQPSLVKNKRRPLFTVWVATPCTSRGRRREQAKRWWTLLQRWHLNTNTHTHTQFSAFKHPTSVLLHHQLHMIHQYLQSVSFNLMKLRAATASDAFHMIRSLKKVKTGGTRSNLPGMIPLLGPESSVHEGCVAAVPESKRRSKTQV